MHFATGQCKPIGGKETMLGSRLCGLRLGPRSAWVLKRRPRSSACAEPTGGSSDSSDWSEPDPRDSRSMQHHVTTPSGDLSPSYGPCWPLNVNELGCPGDYVWCGTCRELKRRSVPNIRQCPIASPRRIIDTYGGTTPSADSSAHGCPLESAFGPVPP